MGRTNTPAGFSGAILRRNRLRLGYSAAALAVRIGVRENTVLRWETGLASPTPRHLGAIAESVRLTPADLLTSVNARRTLRDLRLFAALNLDQAAQQAGLSRSALVRLERGVAAVGDRASLLASAYNVDLSEVHAAATETLDAARRAATV